VFEGVEVEDDAFLGPSCVFTNVANPRSFIERKSEFKPTRVGRGASIGANATIVCGYDVGAYCLVGAGSVVPRGVAPHALVVGNPARQLGWVCVCATRLPAAAPGGAVEHTCSACGRRFRIAADRCEAL
jgi:UDP-2-acetamido-3-amino-2,3-dideoxy-glucuronate N-acetyltransferase